MINNTKEESAKNSRFKKERLAESIQQAINKNKIWNRIKPMYDSFQKDTSIVVICIISAILGIIGGLIDSYVTLRMAELPRLVIEGSAIAAPIIGMIVYNAVNNFDGILSRGTMKLAYLRLYAKLQNKYIGKQFSADIHYIINTHTGKMTADINGYCENTANLILYAKRIIFFIPQIIILSVKITEVCGFKALLIDIAIMLFLGIFGYIGTAICDLKDRINANSKVRWIAQDNMQSIRTLRYLGKKSFAMKRLKEAQDGAAVYALQLLRQTVFGSIQTIGASIPLITVLISKGSMDVDGVTYILMSSGFVFMNAIDIIIDLVDTLGMRNDYRATIDGLCDEVEDVYDTLGEGITFDRSMTFGYPESDIIMTNSGFQIKAGERYVITGESGQGKSTLANLLVGVLKPVSGKIKRVHTFYIHQDSECLDSSIRDNLCFGDNISDEELFKYLDMINLGDWVRGLPEGLDTALGERGTKASSGQKQRLNILRSVFKMIEEDDDCLMILDEPTSNLDNETEKLVCELIDRVCKTTLVVITHREAIKSICGHEIIVKDHNFSQIS